VHNYLSRDGAPPSELLAVGRAEVTGYGGQIISGVLAPRLTARAEVPRALGLGTTNLELAGHVLGSYIPADANGDTAIPGVWVAGDVADPLGQVISAAAAGLKAGAAISADLIAEDAARAVAALRVRTLASPDPHSAEVAT
jgi:hypothetical protein